jgi:AcrR family transcriptional regulator
MKDQIIETSLKQFRAEGIRSNTMQKLASVMGISTKTMYKFFTDKQELLEECLKLHYKAAEKEFRDFIDRAPNQVVLLWNLYSKAIELDFGVNQAFYRDLNHYYPELQDKMIVQNIAQVTEAFTGLIQQGIDNGYFLAHLRASIVREALTVLYTSVTRTDVYNKWDVTPEDLMNHTVFIYLRGICTPKGLEIIKQLK